MSAGVARFTVSLTPPEPVPVVLHYATVSGSAVEGVDYLPARGQITIPAGETGALVDVELIPDTEVEGDEQFALVVWRGGSAPAPALVALPAAQTVLGNRYYWDIAEGSSPGSFLLTGQSDSGGPVPAVLRGSGAGWVAET